MKNARGEHRMRTALCERKHEYDDVEPWVDEFEQHLPKMLEGRSRLVYALGSSGGPCLCLT